MKRFRLVLPKWFLECVSNTYLCWHPLFFLYHPNLHRIKGYEVRQVLNVLQKGDIMVRRWNGYLNSFFTPGYWAHAGLYVGNNKVINSLREGVIEEDVLDFCRTDSIAVARPREGDADAAVTMAYELLGAPYDYQFQSGNSAYYCSELCDVCYNRMFRDDYSQVAGNRVLTPGSLLNSPKVTKVIDIRH